MNDDVLLKPNLIHYSNYNNLEFHQRGSDLCVKHATTIGAPALITAYSAAVVTEYNTFSWARRSDFTEKKTEADANRDSVFSVLSATVRAGMKHYNPQIKDAALHINNMLEIFGDVIHMNYDAETAAIDGVIMRMRSEEYLSAAQKLSLPPWVDLLEEANNKFKEYVIDTDQEKAVKPKISHKQARKNTDTCLYKVTNWVEAAIVMTGIGAFAQFIEDFNSLVKHYNTVSKEHLGRTHIRTDIAKASIKQIPAQPYVGTPVYVIPMVTIYEILPDGSKKGVELVFNIDFRVTYINNSEPGMASLVVQGIGKYKGKLTTTFDIV